MTEMPGPDATYQQREEWLNAGYERLRAFVLALADGFRPARPDWRSAVEDAAADIDRIVQRNAHPDDVGWARLAMGNLAHIWLTVEEAEDVAFGAEQMAKLRNGA